MRGQPGCGVNVRGQRCALGAGAGSRSLGEGLLVLWGTSFGSWVTAVQRLPSQWIFRENVFSLLRGQIRQP